MEILALNIAGLWSQWLRPIILLIVGLGAVIFVHELGHFLVAKLVGIKVERFALGFGPRLFGLRRGETDYCINALPLGGYVKMLGQEDFAPLKDGERDPRAFNNKSVGARFAVISAGVVMNVIFAALLFIVVCLAGIRFHAPVVGGVKEGFPAEEARITWSEGPTGGGSAVARLQPGDEIISLNGRKLTRFENLFVSAALAREGETFRMKVRRITPNGVLIGTARMSVKSGKSPSGGKIFQFGIIRPVDTVVGRLEDAIVDDPFQAGDRVVKIADRPIEHYWDIEEATEALDGRPVGVTVVRDGKRVKVSVQPDLRTSPKVFFLKDGTRLRAKSILKDDKDKDELVLRMENGPDKKLSRKKDVVQDKEFLDVLGCRPRVEFLAVLEGSPAEKAGIKPGDVVLAYGDRIEPSYQQFLDTSAASAEAGTNLVLMRDGEVMEAIWIVPETRGEGGVIGVLASADMSEPVVTGLRKGSPARAAGIIPGDVILKISASGPASGAAAARPARRPARESLFVTPPEPPGAPATAPASAPAGTDHRPVKTWPDVVAALTEFRGREVTITYRRGGIVAEARIGELTEDIFSPGDYKAVLFAGRPFNPLRGPVVRKGPLAAMAWGAGETWLFILRTYATLRSLLNRTISHKEVIGPVGMGDVAIQVGRESVVKLVYFMAMISVSLAVINFLPIPVVDGGHAVFLIVEKIRGRPVPVKIMNIVQVAGLALLLFVFVAVTWQDISRLISNW